MQTLVQLRERFGRMTPKTIPSFVCRPQLRKAGSGSELDLGIFEMMLYGDMKRGEVSSVVRGGWNCSG